MLLPSVMAVLVGGLVLETAASPLIQDKREVPASHSLHERHMPQLAQRWSKRSKVSQTQILPMRIGLKQSNLEDGHDKLMDM